MELISSLPSDIYPNILYFSDVQTNIAFLFTSKSAKVPVSKSLTVQFDSLIDYCQNSYLNDPLPSLGKRIFYKWKKVKSFLDSNPDKSLILVKIKKIFGLLKMFYEVIEPIRQDQILNLECPSFIEKMLSLDLDHNVWMEKNFTQKKINSLIGEFKKVRLFEKRYYEEDALLKKLGLSKYPGASFFLDDLNRWNPELKIQVFTQNTNLILDCKLEISDQINTKWINIKKFYALAFCQILPHEIFYSTPIHDLKLKREHYDFIRKGVSELTFFEKKITEKKMEEFRPLKYCLRFSSKKKDEYSEKALVLSTKSVNGKLSHTIIGSMCDFQNMDHFKKYIDEELKQLKANEKLQYATTTISSPK